MIQAAVTTSGPLFDGRAEAALEEFAELVPDRLGDEGVQLVRTALGGVLQNPSGFYESQIQTDELAPDRTSVWDGGVIYGPWLAGTGSMNDQTGFPGYEHWQMATQALDGRAVQVAEAALQPFLDRMNG